MLVAIMHKNLEPNAQEFKALLANRIMSIIAETTMSKNVEWKREGQRFVTYLVGESRP